MINITINMIHKTIMFGFVVRAIATYDAERAHYTLHRCLNMWFKYFSQQRLLQWHFLAMLTYSITMLLVMNCLVIRYSKAFSSSQQKEGDFNDSIHNKCSPGEHLHNHGNEHDHYFSFIILLCLLEEYCRWIHPSILLPRLI